jgi:drug/metabolite transporter (DMT)-like permease
MTYSWLSFALAGSFIGAVVHIIDTYLFKKEAFSDPVEPAIISGVMQAMAWVTIPFVNFTFPESGFVAVVAILGGLFYITSLFLYFKALFSFGDISLITILWNLLLGMVPILAYVFLKETLSFQAYLGIALLFLGANIVSYSNHIEKKIFWKVFSLMMLAICCMALSLIGMKYVFSHTPYWSGYFLYNFGMVLGGLLGYIFFLKKKNDKKFFGTIRRFYLFFFGIEFLQLLGDFFSSLAVNFGPVSLVTAVESLQALFIVILAVAVVAFLKRFKGRYRDIIDEIQVNQLGGFRFKLGAMMAMVVGAYLVG